MAAALVLALVVQMIKPETVNVLSYQQTYDEIGEPEGETITETAVDVIVAPGATDDLSSSRPEGVSVAYTLHFPKTWTGSLRGCKVRVRGEVYTVIGDPQPYTLTNTPTPYYLPCEVTRADG